jgi:3-oxoacyl-[acyl-carrier-protein] synthase-3
MFEWIWSVDMPTPDRPQCVVRIAGTGSYVPEKILTNADLERIVETSDKWIVERSGIRERRIAPPDVPSSGLAEHAARAALADAGVMPEDLDAIVVATVTPDRFFPSTACTLQDKLGAHRAFAFDIAAACSGFLYGLEVGSGLIATGSAKTVLLIGVESLTKITDWTDRTTCVLFGDGAGAVILRPAEESERRRILSIILGSNGSLGDLLHMPGGGSSRPISHEVVDERLHFVKMKGNEVFKIAVRGMEQACVQALEAAGLRVEDVDLLVPHQANLRMIEATAKRLGVPMDKVFVTIHKYGNTSSSSVPIALDEACRSGRLGPGSLAVMVAFGGGLTWGSAVVRM